MSTPPEPLSGDTARALLSGRRRSVILVLRLAFLLLVAAFVWWGVRGRMTEIHAGLASTSPMTLLGALVFVLAGLLCTGLMWRMLLPVRVPAPAALSVFFIGQLGKYLPGSVWSFGAQAQLARRHRVAPRVTVAASLVFLGVNIATAVLLGGLIAACGGASLAGRGWLFGIAALGALLSLHPAVIRRLARKIAGTEFPLPWRMHVGVLALMVSAWACYAASVGLLGRSSRPSVIAALTAGMLLAYAAGVVVVLAPAGLGAREATFVAVASPVTGFPAAAAVALLSRVVFTAADIVAAVVAWMVARRAHAPTATQSAGSHEQRSVFLKNE